jgi:uncharacterized protein
MTNIIRRTKKIAAFMLLINTFTLAFPLAASAADVLWDSYEIPSTRQKPRVYDCADLLTDDEESSVTLTLDTLSEQYKCSIAILTTDSHNGSIQEYADDYFDYNGFCSEYNDNGILFMLSMEDREWAISTSGDAQYAVTDYGQEYMTERMLPYLREGAYYDAFCSYAGTCDYFLDLYSKGTPYDVGYEPPKTAADYRRYAIISIVIGIIVGAIPIFVMKSGLNNVKMASGAAGYSRGGVQLTVKEDLFINKTLTKTARPKENESRSGSSGGSTLHTSSSGHSHGGSHGHF